MSKLEPQASLNIKLNDFDGPLDVLETLIREHKMDILNLDVSMLTEQYVKFINKYIDVISIEQASEYLIMASYLLELKSKKVLPIENTGLPNSNFEYERDKLVHRILEYKKIKDIIPKLLNKQMNRLEMYAKPADDLETYATEEIKAEELPDSVNPEKLLKAIQVVFEKWRSALWTRQQIIVQELAIDDVEKDILNFLSKKGAAKITFSKFLESVDELKISQQYIVTCFSALLELVKYQQILLFQENIDDDLLFCINNKKDEMHDSLMKA